MNYQTNDVNINYVRYRNNSFKTVVFLHGWGQNIEMMMPIAEPFKDECDILIIDLPGFGNSSEPKYSWTVYDYATCLKKIFEKENIKEPIIVGHSFGGKVALVYASMYEVKKLVLLASPFKPEISKQSFKTKVLKTMVKVPGLKEFGNRMKKKIGSNDYKNASEIMRGVLVKSINIDLSDDVKKIKCPTLLIWGTLDTAVPLKRAYELKDLISNSAVIEYDNCTHYAYLEDKDKTVRIIKSFLKEN